LIESRSARATQRVDHLRRLTGGDIGGGRLDATRFAKRAEQTQFSAQSVSRGNELAPLAGDVQQSSETCSNLQEPATIFSNLQ
jgi:hypothetical protein